MSRDRVITDGKLPDRVCPECGRQVLKVVKDNRLQFECKHGHWGPWDESKKPWVL